MDNFNFIKRKEKKHSIDNCQFSSLISNHLDKRLPIYSHWLSSYFLLSPRINQRRRERKRILFFFFFSFDIVSSNRNLETNSQRFDTPEYLRNSWKLALSRWHRGDIVLREFVLFPSPTYTSSWSPTVFYDRLERVWRRRRRPGKSCHWE